MQALRSGEQVFGVQVFGGRKRALRATGCEHLFGVGVSAWVCIGVHDYAWGCDRTGVRLGGYPWGYVANRCSFTIAQPLSGGVLTIVGT